MLPKCLVKRIKYCLQFLSEKDKMYCVPSRSFIDNIFVLRDLVDFSHLNNSNLGILSLDQEKTFDRVVHGYIFYVLKHWFWLNILSYVNYCILMDLSW